MSSTTLATKIDDDAELYHLFEEFRDDQDMTNSEALRSIMRDELMHDSEGNAGISWLDRVALALFGTGFVATEIAPEAVAATLAAFAVVLFGVSAFQSYNMGPE